MSGFVEHPADCQCGKCIVGESETATIINEEERFESYVIPPKVPRWQMKKDGRVFIVYGSLEVAAAIRDKYGYTDLETSGHYSYTGNSIIEPRDGPTSFEDYRPSGRLYG